MYNNFGMQPGTGYQNPYAERYAAMMGNAPGMSQAYGGQTVRVNGKNGAEAFRMAPNSSALLMDENDPIVWMKTSDGAGYCTVTPYTVAPYQKAEPVDFFVRAILTAEAVVFTALYINKGTVLRLTQRSGGTTFEDCFLPLLFFFEKISFRAVYRTCEKFTSDSLVVAFNMSVELPFD